MPKFIVEKFNCNIYNCVYNDHDTSNCTLEEVTCDLVFSYESDDPAYCNCKNFIVEPKIIKWRLWALVLRRMKKDYDNEINPTDTWVRNRTDMWYKVGEIAWEYFLEAWKKDKTINPELDYFINKALLYGQDKK